VIYAAAGKNGTVPAAVMMTSSGELPDALPVSGTDFDGEQ
jgi:hypothetical protein